MTLRWCNKSNAASAIISDELLPHTESKQQASRTETHFVCVCVCVCVCVRVGGGGGLKTSFTIITANST